MKDLEQSLNRRRSKDLQSKYDDARRKMRTRVKENKKRKYTRTKFNSEDYEDR